MATLTDAVLWIAQNTGLDQPELRALDRAYSFLLTHPGVCLAAGLWHRSPAEVSVKVLKAAERKVPRNWLEHDRPRGRFETRERLLSSVWQMVFNQRLTSEIARETGISTQEVSAILETYEGLPPGEEIQPHRRQRFRATDAP